MNKLNVVFRADSSSAIGSGHLMRCLSLAQYMQWQMKAQIFFISRDLDGNINQIVRNNNFSLLPLPKHSEDTRLVGYEKWLTVSLWIDAQETKQVLAHIEGCKLLVVDHYALDSLWEKDVRPFVNKILAIDDLATRKHDCDYLLDQSFGRERQSYKGLVPIGCKLFLGIEYVLLNRKYYLQVSHIRHRIRNVLVFFGGSDETGETLKFLTALSMLACDSLHFNVIVGSSNLQRYEIEKACKNFSNVDFHCQVNDMERFIAEADLAFGAAGSNTWERCQLGLPAIVTVTGDNQRFIAEQVEKAGAVKRLGWHEAVNPAVYCMALAALDDIPLADMSGAAYSIMGSCRIAEMIEAMREELYCEHCRTGNW